MHFDGLETRDPEQRESSLFARVPRFLEQALAQAPGLRRWLKGINPSDVTSRAALASLPVLRKSELMAFQASDPPFGGFADIGALRGSRIFLSPGPLWEPEAPGQDPGGAARAFFAAGIRPGDIVHNVFAYHMTPGGFLLDAGARALGCTVFAAGTGNTEMQIEAAAALRPRAYCGTPDYLKVMLDKADEMGRDLSCISKGLVSAGALFPSLRAEYRGRGIDVLQCYATAEFGVIAYESAADDGQPNLGLIVNEDLIVEIVRPGTGEVLPDGEVGELVVTNFNPAYPLVRLGTGDLSAILPGTSPCGRTNARIKGWMGRADQRTKVRGMFVDPKQIAEIVKRHPTIKRARLVVTRQAASDVMALHVETDAPLATEAVESTLREITKLRGAVILAAKNALPNDGKVISDERDYSS